MGVKFSAIFTILVCRYISKIILYINTICLIAAEDISSKNIHPDELFKHPYCHVEIEQQFKTGIPDKDDSNIPVGKERVNPYLNLDATITAYTTNEGITTTVNYHFLVEMSLD